MLSTFNFPGKDTRIIRCGSTVYKITIQSNGDPNRFLVEQLLCDGDTIQKDLNIAVDTVIAMTRRSKLHQFRTDHLVFMPKRKPWKASTFLNFTQYSERLNAHPYILVLTVDSCQRYLQRDTVVASKKKKRPADTNLFAEPAPKAFKKTTKKLIPQSSIITPIARSVSSSVASSAVSRKGMQLDNRLLQLMDKCIRTPKQVSNTPTYSPEEAQRILNKIAAYWRPRSARQPGANFNLLQGNRREVQTSTPQANSEEGGSTTQSSGSKTPLLRKCEATSHRYDLRRRAYSSSVSPNEYSDAQPVYHPSKTTDVQHRSPKEKSPSSMMASPETSGYEIPKTRSRTRQSSSERQPEAKPQLSFFSILLTPFKRLLQK